jgi:polyhydroxyalkanoate synthesis regulator phasin
MEKSVRTVDVTNFINTVTMPFLPEGKPGNVYPVEVNLLNESRPLILHGDEWKMNETRKKIFLLGLILLQGIGWQSAPIQAESSVPVASARSVENLDKRVSTLEARLGRNVTTPTATNNLERRLDDLEDRIEELEKLAREFDKLERRVRELERKR